MLLGSVTDLKPSHRGLHVVVGSHGGHATGRHALRFGVASLICHDAGIGKDDAGVLGLSVLGAARVPAAAVGHETARIGDPEDMFGRGLVTRVNAPAQALGARPGMAVAAAHALFEQRAGAPAAGAPGADGEAAAFGRTVLEVTPSAGPARGFRVVIADSASSVVSADDGAIIITGSHGGLPGNAAAKAMRARPVLAVFNDAGCGIERAGIRRLPVLDEQGIAAACVSAWSARIGEGRSTYETGVVSFINERARERGVAVGMAVGALVRELVDRMAAAPPEPDASSDAS